MVTVLKITHPDSERQWQQYYQLRWRVLRAPWDQPVGSERDELEDKSEHIMVFSDTEQLLGVGRVHFNNEEQAQIRYMAVDEQVRGYGVGTILLTELEAIARKQGASVVVLDARENAVSFYAGHGYQVIADGHTLYGVIHHKKMLKNL